MVTDVLTIAKTLWQEEKSLTTLRLKLHIKKILEKYIKTEQSELNINRNSKQITNILLYLCFKYKITIFVF